MKLYKKRERERMIWDMMLRAGQQGMKRKGMVGNVITALMFGSYLCRIVTKKTHHDMQDENHALAKKK
jgi:hypothetical protein